MLVSVCLNRHLSSIIVHLLKVWVAALGEDLIQFPFRVADNENAVANFRLVSHPIISLKTLHRIHTVGMESVEKIEDERENCFSDICLRPC